MVHRAPVDRPAKVGGKWRLGDGDLVFDQEYQVVKGTLNGTPISDGKLRGDQIRFMVGTAEYTGEGHRQSHGRQRAWCRVRDDVDRHEDQLN